MNFNTGKICLLLAMLIAYTSTMSCSASSSSPGIRGRAFSNPDTVRALQKYQEFKQDQSLLSGCCPPNSPESLYEQAFSCSRPPLKRHANSPKKNPGLTQLTIEIPPKSSDDYVASPQNHFRRSRAGSNDWSSGSSDNWSVQHNPSPILPDLIVQRENAATKAHMQRVEQLLQEYNKEKPNQMKYHVLQAASVILPVVTMAFSRDNSSDQTRFGVAAAATIMSMLPTILTTLVGIYGVYQIDQMLHAEERAAITNLKHAIKLENENRDKEISERFKEIIDLLHKETLARKTGDKDSINNIATLTTDLKQKLSNAVDEYHKASEKLGDALETVAEVKKINEHLLASYPHMMQKLDQILHHTSKMSKNMETNGSGDDLSWQLNNIGSYLNDNGQENNNEETKDESSCAKISADKEKSDNSPKIEVKRTPRQTKISVADPLIFPAGTPVTPSGHASSDIFKGKQKPKNGILDWLAKITSTPASSTNHK